jgi:hypothetical protein
VAREAHEPGHRGDVDDRPAAAGEHGRDLVPQAVPHAGEVHVERAVPVVLGILGGARVDAAHAGGVDGQIEPAEAAHRGVDHLGDVVGAPHVGVHGDGRAAGLAHEAQRLAEHRGLDVGDDERGAAARQRQRGGAADARGAAGDHGDLPGEFLRLQHGADASDEGAREGRGRRRRRHAVQRSWRP